MSDYSLLPPNLGAGRPELYRYIVAVLTVAVVAWVGKLVWRPSLYSKYPLVCKEIGSYEARRKYYVKNAAKVFYDAAEKFKETICRVTTHDGEMLLLPIKYADQLLKLPGDTVDSYRLLKSRMETDILGVAPENVFLVHILRSDLNKHLPRLNESMAEVARNRVLEVLGSLEDWTEVNVFSKSMSIVSVVASSVFVGPELCRDNEWLEMSTRFTNNLFAAATALKAYPQFLRRFAQYWCPEALAVREEGRKAHALLKPVIESRQALRDGHPDSTPSDLIHWLVNKAPKFGKDNIDFLVHSELQLTLAAFNNTNAGITHLLYDIVALCPQIIPELRTEIRASLDKHGGVWSSQALFAMKLFDSVMKESQRFNPNLMITPRTILKPVTFSDGTTIPAGVNVCLAGYAALRDPGNYKDAAKFDPYRFLKLRSGEVEDPLQYPTKELYQYVLSTKEDMAFGYGLHTCPGRFFANSAIKMIVGHILLHYDVKLPDGVKDRYPNLHLGHFVSPDMTKTLMFRDRSG